MPYIGLSRGRWTCPTHARSRLACLLAQALVKVIKARVAHLARLLGDALGGVEGDIVLADDTQRTLRRARRVQLPT